MSASRDVDATALPLGPGVRVVRSHGCGLLALDKPAGVLSHPNIPAEEARSLLTARYDERDQSFIWSDEAGAEQRVWLLHRLDSATSGLVLVARRLATANAVRAAFESRSVDKRYVAIVFGHPRERQAQWRDAIDVRREGDALRASPKGGTPAETRMRRVRLIPGPPALAAIELEPLTGRTHQLRVQCARRHLPILGDQNYGDFKRNRELARRLGTDRLFLHARRLELEFSVDGARVHFTAESALPGEFHRFLDPA